MTTKKAATSAAPTSPEVRLVDPKDLGLHSNIRTDLALDKEFLSSIKQHGVQVPVLAAYDAAGALLVWDGSRRVSAAVQAGLDQIPVVVAAGPGDEVSRIISQDTVNHHRSGLSEADRVSAFEQLSLLGLSQRQIARKTARPESEVAAGLAVAGSKVAREQASQLPQLDLPRLAALAEVEAQAPERVERLLHVTEGGGRGSFDHELSRIQQDLEDDRMVAALRAEREAAGITLLGEAPSWDSKNPVAVDYRLYDSEGRRVDPVEHVSCPGHREWVRVGSKHTVGGYVRRAVADPYCQDPKDHGHATSSSSSAGLTPEQKEAQRAERAMTRENNAAAMAAAEVRGAWLLEFLQRPKFPADLVTVVTQMLATHQWLEPWKYVTLWHLYAGQKEAPPVSSASGRTAVFSAIKTPVQAQRWLLAMVAAGIEGSLNHKNNKAWWKAPQPHVVQWLTALESWGYTLSDVEANAIRPKKGKK